MLCSAYSLVATIGITLWLTTSSRVVFSHASVAAAPAPGSAWRRSALAPEIARELALTGAVARSEQPMSAATPTMSGASDAARLNRVRPSRDMFPPACGRVWVISTNIRPIRAHHLLVS